MSMATTHHGVPGSRHRLEGASVLFCMTQEITAALGKLFSPIFVLMLSAVAESCELYFY